MSQMSGVSFDVVYPYSEQIFKGTSRVISGHPKYKGLYELETWCV